MEQEPFATIIIPSYNHAGYVGDAIQSVLEQTNECYEIIVIDDGSTDETSSIVKQFGNNIRYIWQENQGLSAARNAGITVANGKFIGLLDADDLYEPHFLATMEEILAKNPTVDGVYCISQCVDTDNNVLPQKIGKVVPPEKLYATLRQGGFFPPVCMFVRNDCYRQVGMFDTALQGSADWDMWLRMAKQFTIIGTEGVLTRYRVVPWSMSSDPAHMMKDQIAVLHKVFTTKPGQSIQLSTEQRNAFGRIYLKTCAAYLQRHDFESAFTYLSKALEENPELITDFDALHELGLGDQPRGYRGDYSTINFESNARVLLLFLERLFNDPQSKAQFEHLKPKAYSNAYMALGMIGYGARDFESARYYLLRSIAASPAVGMNSRVGTRLAKTLLPVQFIDWVKQKR